jgi:hypothetical protein
VESKIINFLKVWGFAFQIQMNQDLHSDNIIKNAIDRFVAYGLPFERMAHDERYFDPVEVINFMKWLDIEQKDCFWSEYVVPTGQQLVSSLAKKTVTGRQIQDQRLSINFCRSFNVTNATLHKKNRLRIPIPMFEFCRGEVSIQYEDSNQSVKPLISRHDNYIQIDTTGAGQKQLSISYEYSLTEQSLSNRTPLKNDLSSEDRVIYTRSIEGFIVVTDELQAFAKTIASSPLDADKVHKIWCWVLDNMMIGSIHYHWVDMKNPMGWAINHGIVDCLLGSALIISLCRALGIPSRLVGGYTLYKEAPSQHYWAEIWISGQGWLPYDLLTWDLSRGGYLSDWRQVFEGSIDNRLIMEIFPRRIIGNNGVTLPSRHHRLVSGLESGIKIEYIDIPNGNLIYADKITILN